MDDEIVPADFANLTTYPLAERAHKISVQAFAKPVDPAASVVEFLAGLGDVLAVRQLRGLARRIVRSRRAGRPVIWASGAHAIKVGLAPVLIRLLERGWISAIALNGAAAIHDWEIAAVGATSESVEDGLGSGRFGMARETGEAVNGAAREARRTGQGLGEVLGRRILEAGLRHRRASLLASCSLLAVPATVHVAIGCDVVHAHPDADGAAIGEATFTDFRRLVALVGGLAEGVWINCGSAVQLPEVFVKALSAARNLGHPLDAFSTANLDMMRHYRTEQNVLRRPSPGAGESFELIGHHEINVPLLAAAIEVEAGGGA